MQVTIARQLGLEPTTVGNFFMNARRRSMDKWRDDNSGQSGAAGHSQKSDMGSMHHHNAMGSSMDMNDDDDDMDLKLSEADGDFDLDNDEDDEM